MTSPKLLFLVTEDWYFWSHRLPIAREAQKQGYEILVAARESNHGERIRAEGFKLIPLKMRRRSMNLWNELAAIREITQIYRCEKPDIVHHVAMKPVLYGSFAARIAGVSRVVNALAGLGYVFISEQMKARLLRAVIGVCFRLLLNRKGTRLILQNRDDCAMFIQSNIISEKLIRLIRGSGVDTALFRPAPEKTGIPIIILASRMLWDKGIGEFVEAARLVKDRGIDARFVLVGDCDMDNPNSVHRSTLEEWAQQGVIEWWGQRDDMPDVLAQAHLVCLPSYREGLPKVLLEAAACGLPIVSLDTAGCREVVRHGENGLLVPVKSVKELADAFQLLIEKPDVRRRMGARGREISLKEFAVEKVVAETMAIYEELLCD